MPWKPEVRVGGEWSSNGVVFETMPEAVSSASDLMGRWMLVEDIRAVETTEPINYKWDNGVALPVR